MRNTLRCNSATKGAIKWPPPNDHAKYLPQRKVMMQWWADYLDEQLAKGKSPKLH
jgi:hypothetical protein